MANPTSNKPQPPSSPIVVFGGTGYYGQKVVQKLLAKGVAVRVVSRDRTKVLSKFGDQVEITEGDVTNREVIIQALKSGRAVVICLSAMQPGLIRRMRKIERDAVLMIMEEAENAKISRLLYMSGYEMRAEVLKKLGIPEFGEIKIEIESRIRASSFNWTILGDAPSHELFFAFLSKNKLAVPGGGWNRMPTISAEDVGEITAQAALRDDLSGKRFRMTGPEACSMPEMARKITAVTGQQVRHIAIPLVVVGFVSFLLKPFIPYVRYLYKSLLMFNNFPEDLAAQVPVDHQLLRNTFDYEPVTLDMEIRKRLGSKSTN
jgi:uncharacterized protein YbjT (DUF2867 family)